MTNKAKAIELVQSLYFDICDLAAGDSYRATGYGGRADFLENAKALLEEIETRVASL
jgi:hypothetical protein